MIYAAPGSVFEAVADGWPTGLVGTIGVRIRDNAGADALARTTAGISEDIAGSGIYRTTLTAPVGSGQYSIVWDDGTAFASEDLVVTPSAPAPDVVTGPAYTTVDELKATASLTGTTFADQDIQVAIVAASIGINELLGRRFYADPDATQVRYYTRSDVEDEGERGEPFGYSGAVDYAYGYVTRRRSSYRSLRIDDLIALTSIQTDNDGDGTFENTWVEGTDFVLEPRNAPADSRPYDEIRVLPRGHFRLPGYGDAIKITGQFGWASLPANIKQATTIIATRLLQRARQAPFGVVSLGLDGAVVRAGSIARDPELAFLFEPYTRRRLFI